MKARLNTEKTLCYSEVSGHTARPESQKNNTYELLSASSTWSRRLLFYLCPWHRRRQAGGNVQPSAGQTPASRPGEPYGQPGTTLRRRPARAP
ncbi:hypothetical protein F0Q14_20145 [Escherichia coli]|nr:hypothetical protein [Escherichia coli]